MKHYGLWCGTCWMIDTNGIIFWTTCKAVAEAQAEWRNRGWIVKEFPDDDQNNMARSREIVRRQLDTIANDQSHQE